MKKILEHIFHFFHFNRQERQGIFALCVLIFLLFLFRIFIPVLFGNNSTVNLFNVAVSPDTASITQHKHNDHTYTTSFSNQTRKATELFVFNPNTITSEDLQRLGFSKKLSQTLINFRQKGGKFYHPKDLQKLYGLSPTLYQKLEAYVLIPNPFKKDSSQTAFSKTHTNYPKKEKAIIEINTADSTAMVSLKGIGPGFTKRIIKYRTLLGGFHSVEQLKEVYGMTDSLYALITPQLKVDTLHITKIPINAIDVNSLKKHLYFNSQSAYAIINYRNKHGRLSKTDIITLGIFTEEKLRKILPYLSY